MFNNFVSVRPRIGSKRTTIQRAISSLRARGSDAHLWLPGGDVRTYGPRLEVNGGPFVTTTGWSVYGAALTVSNGELVITNDGVNYGGAYQTISTIPGATYEITGTVRKGTANIVRIRAETALTAGDLVNPSSTSTTNTVQTATFRAVGSTTVIGFSQTNTPSSGTGFYSAISVREITSITPTITSGLTTGNYLESTGNTLATVDNPTGLVLDALGSVSATELVTNGGPFTVTTGWQIYQGTLSVSSSALLATATVANDTRTVYQIPSVAGKTYRISSRIVSTSTGSVVVGTNDTSGSASYSQVTTLGTKGAGETVSGYVVATNTMINLVFRSTSLAIGQTFAYDSVSVREVSGIHLTQATTANKPIVQRGTWNLLLNSVLAGGTSGTWGSGATAPTSWSAGISGTVTYTSESVRFQATAQRPFISQSYAVSAGVSYTASFRVLETSGEVAIGSLFLFSLATATLGTATWKINGIPAITASVVVAGDIVSCSVVCTGTGNINYRFGLGVTGAVTGDITLSQPQLETGSTASAYSPTTTTAGSNPDSGKYALRFDASNDSLLSGNLGITNACTIVIAGRLDSLPTASFMFAEDANGARVGVASTGLIDFNKNAATSVVTSSTGAVVAGVPFVITARLQNGTGVIRMNGVQIATATSALTFSATTGAYIGANFAGSAYLCNGILGTVAALPVALTDAECLLIERMAASQFPNGPVF